MPRTIKTTLELGGESAYKKGLTSVDRALKAMSAELKESTENFAKNSRSQQSAESVIESYRKLTEQQKVKVDSLKEAVETCTKKHEAAAKAYEEAAEKHGEYSAEALKAADALTRAEKSLDDYSAKLKSAEKYLNETNAEMTKFERTSNQSNASKVFEKISQQAKVIKDQLEPVVKICGNIAKAAGKITFKAAEVGAKSVSTAVDTAKKAFAAYTGAVAASGLAIGKWAVSTGKEFDAQMSTVASISGATGDELAALTAKAKEMGQTTSFSATESAQALEYMAMAGWNTTDMTEGLAGVINLAAASGEELATVSDIVTDAMTAFGMSASESEHFSDVLAKTASSANTNVSTMGETFKYVAPLAGAMGYSIEDMSVAIGLMANAGVKGSMSGTSLKNIITNLADPTDEVATAMEELGISLTNSDGSTKTFEETLSQLRNSFSNLDETQKAQYASTIAGKQGMSGLLALVNSSESDFKSLTESIQNCDGAAKKMSETRLDNLQGDITLLKSNAEGVALSLSEKLNPALRFLVKSASDVITAFSQKGIGGALTQISTIIPKIISGVSGKLPSMITSFTTGFNGVITSVVGAVIQTLPTLINDVLPALITGFNSLISSLIAYLPEAIPLLLNGFLTLFGSLIDSVNLVMEQLMPMLPDIITRICEALIENLPVLLDGALQLFLGLIQALDKVVEQLMPMLPQLITNLCDTLIAHIDEIITAGFDLIIGLIEGITECVPTLLAKLPEIIDKLVSTLTDSDNLGKLIDSGIDLIIALAEGLPKAIPDIILAIPRIISAIVDELMKHDWLQVGIDIIKGLADGLIDGVNVIWEKIKEMASNLLDSIKNALGIHSPSKLFRDEVGTFLAQGIGVGFEDEMENVTRKMQKAVPSDFNTVVNADINSFAARPSTSNVTKNNNMTVNYIFEKVTISNDKDIEENAYQLEFMRRKAALAMGGA